MLVEVLVIQSHRKMPHLKKLFWPWDSYNAPMIWGSFGRPDFINGTVPMYHGHPLVVFLAGDGLLF